MTNDLVTFCEQNPNDKRVQKIIAAMNRPFSMNGRIGKLIGELMRELEGKA